MRGGRKSAPAAPAPKPSANVAKWQTPLALLLILVFAAFLRLYQLDSIPPALCSDEAHNGNDILESLETGHFRVFYPQNGGREGLFINLQGAFVYLLGNKPWVLRLPSALIGILTVWGVYYCAAELFSIPIGLAASFFLASSFWHLDFSRIGLRAISAPLFLVWSMYFLLAGFRRAREGRPYLAWMVLAGAVYGLGFHSYTAYRATPALLAVILIYRFRGAGIGIAAFGAATAAAAAPLTIYFLGHTEEALHRSAEVSIFNGPRSVPAYLFDNISRMTQMIFTRGDTDWLHNIALRPAVYWPVAILFAGGVVLAVVRRSFPAVVVLAWLVMGAIPALLSKDNMPNSIRSILMLPAVCMLAAVGADWLYTKLAGKLSPRWIQAAAAVLIAALCYEPYHNYFDVWAASPSVAQTFNTAGYDIAERINRSPSAEPKYVVVVAPGQTGLPPSAQTVMFLTRSYTERQRASANIHYIARERPDEPEGVAFCQKVAASKSSGDLFCLQLVRVTPPAF